MLVMRQRGWLAIALITAIIGYIIPLLHFRLAPTIQFFWGDSLLTMTAFSWLTDTSWFFRILLPLPLILAIIGWAGFLKSKNAWHLRYGFWPILATGVVFASIAIYTSLYGEPILPLNSVAFFVSALASHSTKHIKPESI